MNAQLVPITTETIEPLFFQRPAISLSGSEILPCRIHKSFAMSSAFWHLDAVDRDCYTMWIWWKARNRIVPVEARLTFYDTKLFDRLKEQINLK